MRSGRHGRQRITRAWRSSSGGTGRIAPCRLQHPATQNATRWLSQQPGGDGSGTSSKDQHAFFEQQMMELENERKSFFPSDAGEIEPASAQSASSSSNDNSAFVEQMKEWKAEQRQIFGKELEEEDLTGGSVLATSSRDDNSKDEQEDYDDDVLEDQKQERELLYAFSAHERSAWGSLPEKNAMQQILEEVAEARKRLEEGGDKPSGAVASEGGEHEKSPPAEHHHESFSHVSEDGNSVHMVDVGHKAVTPRMAHAQTKVILPPSVLTAFGLDQQHGNDTDNATTELVGPKGPIFATAKIAGIMAAKNTSNLIPLCHPLPLDQVKIDIHLAENSNTNDGIVVIDCTCRVTHKTGVEMEALTGASVAALTIYDMTKAVSHEICITETKLIAKTGGKRTVQDGVNET